MKKGITLLAVFLLGGGLFAQTVAEEEVRVPGTIRFENNEGVPDKVETAAQIRGIGVVLGQNPGARERQYYGRYRVQHIVDPSQQDLFDADIISLDRTASVDHIRNLRFILSGYLGAAYKYSDGDAALLAQFVTIYNAVYRKNMEYFRSKYKGAVMAVLEADKAGLSTSWREWPGGTQILLPLSGPPGSLSTIDTGAISDKTVVEELRKQEDMGIESRKDMVDLRERQIEEQQKQLDEEKRRAEEERKAVAQREQDVKRQQEAAEQEKKAATTEEQRQEAEKKEQAAREEAAKVEEEKKALEEKQAAIAREETRIEERKDEVREDRREIAKDQEAVLARDSTTVSGIPFIKVSSAAKGRLLLIDTQGNVLGDTEEQAVTIRVYEAFGGGLVALLQRPGSDTGRLCILDRGSLKEKIAAREEVYAGSYFQVNGTELFVVIRDQGKWYLGKYDSALALLARSKTEVNPETFILFADAHVFVEDPGGNVVPLSLTLN